MKKNLHIIIISFLFSVILWVSISLSNDYYATFNIPVKLIDFPEGYTTGTKLPSTVSVKLKGKGWKLITATLTSESDYVIPVGKETGKRTINLSHYLVENQWLSTDVEVINISPDTLTFDVEKISTKKVPIIPDLKLKFKSGFGLASKLTFSPESTFISGPDKSLKHLYSISTEKLEFENLDSKIKENVSLEKLPGMTYSSPTVRINLDVQKIVDKTFVDIFVKVDDVPRDRDVVLLPNRINVGVRGGIDILGRLDSTQFKSFVNYREVVEDTLGSIVPHVRIPYNTTLIFIKPERLRYIIKKFN